ncbi:hypothetical protein CDL12_17282 [Handroanthus impetiginosus]|uniref:Uncharacterized protein n=1 Tax=Handroanthus impetiginosus TaxID=429701 RepID=A0A2G9GXX5_9LAMI|nr:hypothetical protein CDL12_17282 [Handroanthus impetiginosus]
MEKITDVVSKINISESQKKNGIQVSSTKKLLFLYVNLAKRYMQQHNEVELSALGMEFNEEDDKGKGKVQKPINKCRYLSIKNFNAISTVVSVAELLKSNDFAVEKKVTTSTMEIQDDSRGRPIQKAKVAMGPSSTITNKDNLRVGQATEQRKDVRGRGIRQQEGKRMNKRTCEYLTVVDMSISKSHKARTGSEAASITKLISSSKNTPPQCEPHT